MSAIAAFPRLGHLQRQIRRLLLTHGPIATRSDDPKLGWPGLFLSGPRRLSYYGAGREMMQHFANLWRVYACRCGRVRFG
jgi:hypothetical protein